jgi:hypothetical protein
MSLSGKALTSYGCGATWPAFFYNRKEGPLRACEAVPLHRPRDGKWRHIQDYPMPSSLARLSILDTLTTPQRGNGVGRIV